MRFSITATFAFLSISALTLTAAEEPKPELPPAVRALVDLARSASPELFADTVVRLVEARAIPPGRTQVELLEDAFSAAAGATEPLHLGGLPSIPPDTRAMFRARAAQLNLDRLSLQSHILKVLLTIDPAKARELFDHIPRPSLEPAACDDPMVSDDSAYFEIAGALARSAFTVPEMQKDVHLQFLASLLEESKSPGEIAPFLHALDSTTWTPPQLELLVSTIAATLVAVPADYRSFSMSLPSLDSELSKFIDLAQGNRIGAEGLTRAYRSYLVSQMKAARCQPDFPPLVQQLALAQRLAPPLTEDDMRPVRRNGMFQADPYFQSDDSRRLGDALQRLRSHTLSAPESHSMLADFLRDFAAWTPAGSDMDVFHQKAVVLAGLLQATPPGEDRDRVLNICVAFLQTSEAERQSPAEWLWQVKSLMEAAAADSPKMMEGFRASGSVGLTLYAAMNGSL